jgi:hypothetical protein
MPLLRYGHPNEIVSLACNYKGTLIASSCRVGYYLKIQNSTTEITREQNQRKVPFDYGIPKP